MRRKGIRRNINLKKTSFHIAKMDCPSEEQMIRMKLADLSTIQAMEFDIPNRTLLVFHVDSYDSILEKLEELKFDTEFVSSENTNSTEFKPANEHKERILLWQVLAINFFFFVLEISTGILAKSMGLLADSLDMLADSMVYGMALFAVGGSILLKKRIAKVAGYFQFILATVGFIEVIRRFLFTERLPSFQLMLIISSLALIGNAICLYLLQKSKSKEAHMQASLIFTSNDVIVNLGVIIAGALVFISNSMYPDLLIGSIVFVLVARGAIKIVKL
jgi:Co/Zn/Cd efflux system component